MIKSIIFDIGNVLLPFDFSIAQRRVEQQCACPVDGLLHRLDPVKVLYETGRIGSEQFLKEVIALIDYQGSEADLTAAWEDIFVENVPMTKVVESLHGRYPLYLLSNTNEIHANYFTKRYAVFNHFSDAVYSHKVCCLKPGREIYEVTARQFGILPQEAIFIDDLAPNIETALELGFNAIQYDFRNHEALLTRLREFGIEI